MTKLTEEEQKERYQQILQKAVSYCTYQERCRQEVERKLDKFDTSEEWKELIIEWLQDNSFLDEQRFASTYACGKFRSNKWGKNKIRVYLKRLEVPDQLIENGLKEIDVEEYESLIDKLIEKKKREVGPIKSFAEKQKIIRYMLQKGFEHDLFVSRIY